ncbi:hypothetical protein [Magnetofaba australis]|uniref:Putative lipoprotein n=1 Tax=Magnetofaba australis IT-1 TaxID=1434232 RepID=A0A1Y2K6D4_9PROT|nr:hypothetical protein [Magnetofaba australis]OSM05090.1 putative lipoprotein [Magnetofaba australis IT-1]
MKKTLSLIACAALLSGCATMAKGMDGGMIEVHSNTPAECEFTDAMGTRTFSIPGQIKADASSGPGVVMCHADGFLDMTQQIDTEFNGATVGNILLGGVIGLVVDAATGNTSAYPSHVIVSMEPVEFGSLAEEDQWRADNEKWVADVRNKYEPQSEDFNPHAVVKE